MKNYYDTQKELELINSSLKVLYESREILKPLVEPKSVMTDKVLIDSGTLEPDKAVVDYTHTKILIDEEIELREKEKRIREVELAGMEKALREHTGLERRIFVMRYLDNWSTRRIAHKVSYSNRQVDRILENIDKRINKKHVSKCLK